MYNYTSSQTTLNGLTIKKNIATDKLNCEALNTNWKQVENIQWMPQKNQLFLDKEHAIAKQYYNRICS